MGQFFNVHSDNIPSFCFINRNNWCIGFGVDFFGCSVIGDFAAVVAAGVAWVVAGATSSAEAIVVPVKTVPKTTEAKVKVCLREISYIFQNTSPF